VTTRGFTLVELLLAMALTAVVASSALGALGMFAEADTRLRTGVEAEVDVGRALRLLQQDVAHASTLDVTASSCTLTRPDGTAVTWVATTGGTELHRLTARNLLSLTLPVLTLLATTTTAAQYDARGMLRDGSYRSSAVLQGIRGVAMTALTSPVDGEEIGVHLRILHATADGSRRTAGTAVSLPLCEEHGRP
jgi:prepilin-type N-terminal cleavage/methylation domain-containing protein